jgi:hypothetical protein
MKPWMVGLLGLLLLLKLYQWLGQLQLSLPILLVAGAVLALTSNRLTGQTIASPLQLRSTHESDTTVAVTESQVTE